MTEEAPAAAPGERAQEQALSLHDDGERIGHAVLRFASPLEAAPALALRFPDGTALGSDGRRERGLHLFATQPVGEPPFRAVRLGPEVTAHVREAEVVTFVDAAGAALGTVAWEGVRPPPAAGARLRLAASGVGRRGLRLTAPVLPGRPAAPTEPEAAEPAAAPAASAVSQPAPPPAATAQRRRRGPGRLAAAAATMAVAAALAGILGGFVGWRLEPAALAFSGPAGGPFQPMRGEVRLALSWYARPFLRRPPVPTDNLPDWLVAEQTRDGEGWLIAISPSGTARDLAPGGIAAALPLAFPLRRVAEAVTVTLDVTQPPMPAAPKAPPSPSDAAQPPGEPAPAPEAAHTVLPKTSAAQTARADALCDRLAGNRFDTDHPAGSPHIEEVFALSPAELVAGLAACDGDPARGGAARRFGVQRGRLLAHRALTRLAAGDAAGAGEDMDAAVALWRRGDELGSAYAANLLGAFYGGIFNRPGHEFVVADDRSADEYWRRAMEGGNTVAQRNYAVQLLTGKGVAPDPQRALALLRNAADKGEVHAAGILGAALFTGEPAGVTHDAAAAWPLLVAAQCVDKRAAVLVAAEVAAGRQSAGEQRDCR